MRRVFSVFFLLLLLTSNSAFSKDNDDPFGLTFYGSFLHTKQIPNALFFFDEIKKDDSFELRKALRNKDIKTIVLASPGGSVWEGLQIAAAINDKGIYTYIPYDTACASACAFMFFGGKARVANGDLGVHQFYSSSANKETKIGEAQGVAQYTVSEIIGFLNDFSTPPFVYEKMFQASEMYYFDRTELREIETPDRNNSPISIKEMRLIQGFLESFKTYLEQLESDLKSSELSVVNRPKQNPLSPKSQPDKQKTTIETDSIVEKVTSDPVVKAIQTELNKKGCNAGPADGLIGNRTRSALKWWADSFGGGKTVPVSSLTDPSFYRLLKGSVVKCEPLIKNPPKTKTAQKVINPFFLRFKDAYEKNEPEGSFGRIFAVKILAQCDWGNVDEIWYAYQRGKWYHIQNPIGSSPDFADRDFHESWTQSFFGKGDSKVYRKAWNRIEASGEGCEKIVGTILK